MIDGLSRIKFVKIARSEVNARSDGAHPDSPKKTPVRTRKPTVRRIAGAGANMPTWGEKLEAYRRLQQKTHLAVGFPGLARPPAGGLVAIKWCRK